MERKRLNDQDMDEFEQRLRQAMALREAPVGLKSRVLAGARERRRQKHGWRWMMQRVAASAALATVVGGFVVYREAEERHKGDEAREQVMTALRITNRTLDKVNARLTDDGR